MILRRIENLYIFFICSLWFSVIGNRDEPPTQQHRRAKFHEARCQRGRETTPGDVVRTETEHVLRKQPRRTNQCDVDQRLHVGSKGVVVGTFLKGSCEQTGDRPVRDENGSGGQTSRQIDHETCQSAQGRRRCRKKIGTFVTRHEGSSRFVRKVAKVHEAGGRRNVSQDYSFVRFLQTLSQPTHGTLAVVVVVVVVSVAACVVRPPQSCQSSLVIFRPQVRQRGSSWYSYQRRRFEDVRSCGRYERVDREDGIAQRNSEQSNNHPDSEGKRNSGF